MLALHVKKQGYLKWYVSQLLEMAKDIGYRLLPAFDTTTGIPHPRVSNYFSANFTCLLNCIFLVVCLQINLKYGMNCARIGSLRETCTACAGTMILEFAALARLTNEPIFEVRFLQFYILYTVFYNKYKLLSIC